MSPAFRTTSPCPKESYCNLAANTCEVGCLMDAECAEVSGATATGVTTIKLTISGTVKTFMITGNGSQQIYNDAYDFYCFMGMCAGWTHSIEVTSTSDSPVKVDFSFYVSATR